MLERYHQRIQQAVANKILTADTVLDACLEQIGLAMQELPPEAAEAIAAILVTRQFEKGSFLLREGEVCTAGYWIESGVVRKYTLTPAGKEITSELCFTYDLAMSLQSYTLQLPSREYIQAVTSTTVSLIRHQDYEPLKQRFPALHELDRILTEFYALWLEERLWQFHTWDAAERYRQLLQRYPHFVREVPLTYIASYLGITLETLSRIRARTS